MDWFLKYAGAVALVLTVIHIANVDAHLYENDGIDPSQYTSPKMSYADESLGWSNE